MPAINHETSKPYPGIDLGRAYQYLLRLKGVDLTRGLRSNDLMYAIGYSKRGGRVSRVLGAFRQFGFATFDGALYTFTDLGRDIVSSTGADNSTNKELAMRAARSPRLYESIYIKTNGSREILLSDELVGMMANYGIARDNMESVLKNYNETLRFVDRGVMPKSQAATSIVGGENKLQTTMSEEMIRIDFDDNLIIEVPRDLVITASLRDLAKNGPASKVRLIASE